MKKEELRESREPEVSALDVPWLPRNYAAMTDLVVLLLQDFNFSGPRGRRDCTCVSTMNRDFRQSRETHKLLQGEGRV